MNTFYIYNMNLDAYTRLMDEEMMDDNERMLHLNQHLLVSGTNRRIITEILRLSGVNDVSELPDSDKNQVNMSVFAMKYTQIQDLLQNEVRMAAGHFSHTIHRVNLAAFYYLSFNVARELTVILLKDELPDGAIDRQNWEGVPPAYNFSRLNDVDWQNELSR